MSVTTINAVFGATRKTVTNPLYMYDIGITLHTVGIRNLPEYFEAHFANSEGGTATTMMGHDADVVIPNALLTTGLPVYCWIYVIETETQARTVYEIKIPVKQRARPSGEDVTPSQQAALDAAIAALNTSEANAAESATAAAGSEENAEAWAVGQRDGVDVASGDPTYHNNAKYYAEAAAAAEGYRDQAQAAAASATASESAALGYKNDAQEAARDAEKFAGNAAMSMANAGFFNVELDARDHLIFTRTSTAPIDFEIDDRGHLLMEIG